MNVLLFIGGTIINSFAVCFGYDWGKQQISFYRRSRCDNCKSSLEWYQLVPLLSQLLFCFRCNKCKKSISIKYFVAEITGGLSLVALYYIFDNLTIVTILLMNLIFQLIFVIDIHYYWIPDLLQLILCLLLVPYSNFSSLVYGIYIMILFFIFCLFFPNKIGGGDIKLFSILTILLQVEKIPIFLALASFLGILYYYFLLIFDNRLNRIPFSPFIIISFIITYSFKYLLR